MNFDKRTIHSHNLYKIFTYVKNYNVNFENKEVAGLLLYAKADEDFQFNERSYQMSGNCIAVRSLDLNCDFNEIVAQLNHIIEQSFELLDLNMEKIKMVNCKMKLN